MSYIIPTRDRQARLAATLNELAKLDSNLHDEFGGAEVIVIDNDSSSPVRVPSLLENGLPVQLLKRPCNEAAAARNHAAREASGSWLVMLDDDSYPLNSGLLRAISECDADVAAVGAEILLPNGNHESGGLPEVIIGCGAAIRKNAYLHVGGYDSAFHYYAEEYDLCAKLIIAGHRIIHDRRFKVIHHKVDGGRDMNTILSRLVRNNGWVDIRYAPENRRLAAMQETVSRYERIARREGALRGYRQGLAELSATAQEQVRSPMSDELFDRFTGLRSASEAISYQASSAGLRKGNRISLAHEGKNAWAVMQACEEAGLALAPRDENPDAIVVATLSPGPILDARRALEAAGETRPVISARPFVEPASCEVVVPRRAAISW